MLRRTMLSDRAWAKKWAKWREPNSNLATLRLTAWAEVPGVTQCVMIAVAGEQALSSAELTTYLKSHSGVQLESAHLTTDDWPYFYQHEPGVPLIIVIMSVLLVALTRLLIWKTGAAGQAINWHFFFLGAGFLLLEAQIVSRMAMLFGTTWLVNSIVIAAILLLIVAVNFLVEFMQIGACMLVSYFLPLEKTFSGFLGKGAVGHASVVFSGSVCFDYFHSQFGGIQVQRPGAWFESFGCAGRRHAGVGFVVDRNPLSHHSRGGVVFAFAAFSSNVEKRKRVTYPRSGQSYLSRHVL